MKMFFAVMSCLAMLTLSAEEAKQMRRHMDGKTAVKTYQKEIKAAASQPPEEVEELTRTFFAKNYKTIFAPYYAKDESGAVVMTRQIDMKTGKIKTLDKSVKVTPATPREVWETLESGDTIIVRTSLQETCGFCDGLRYVFYFDEEVKALEEFHDKYHKQHAVKDEDDDDKKRNRDPYDAYDNRKMNQQEKNRRRRERKEEEYEKLVASAERFNWTELLPEIRKALGKGESGNLEDMACCWAEIHSEKSARRFRHMCPVCKGKTAMKVTRFRKFEVGEK